MAGHAFGASDQTLNRLAEVGALVEGVGGSAGGYKTLTLAPPSRYTLASKAWRLGRMDGPRLVPNPELERDLVLRGDAKRAEIVDEIGKAARPSVEALLRLDPNARVGFRGSLARGLKGDHKLDRNGNRVAFDGNVAYVKNRQTGRYEPYAGPQGYDADFFVVSNKLADQLGNKRTFMDASKLDGSLRPVFDAFGRSMQTNPALSGMKTDDVTFRVWSEEAMGRKVEAGDTQFYFLP